MRYSKTIPVVLLFVALVAGCKKNETTQPGQEIPPWDIGQTAEAVLGQSDLTFDSTRTPGQNTINNPWGLAVDVSGTLFVIDQRAYRVLRFNNATTKPNGANADGVLGQPNFTSNTWNYPSGTSAVSATGFSDAQGIALDKNGTLFVLDGNSRVLRFNNAASKPNGAEADGVLGQQSFTTNNFNTTASTFFSPQNIALDANGNLYVADGSNNRVLRFDNAAQKGNGANADAVLGQSNFTTGTGDTSATKMKNPTSLAVDNLGNLYVGERGNSRVLIFLNAAAKANGAAADIVLGKSTFTDGSTPTVGNSSAIYLPYYLAVDENRNLYVADGGFFRVMVFYNAPSLKSGAPANAVLGKSNFTDISTTGVSSTNVGQTYGVAVHSAAGKLFISDYSNSRVLRFQAKSNLHP